MRFSFDVRIEFVKCEYYSCDKLVDFEMDGLCYNKKYE